MQITGAEANRRLAELLGWTNIFDVGGALLGTPPDGEPQCRSQAKVPDWTGDWRECGPLLARHLREVSVWQSIATASASPTAPSDHIHAVRQHNPNESTDDTVRRVMVDAVIAKLEARQ